MAPRGWEKEGTSNFGVMGDGRQPKVNYEGYQEGTRISSRTNGGGGTDMDLLGGKNA